MNAYVVIRVPKCGSTSLARMITSAMPNSKVFYISSAGIELACLLYTSDAADED